MIITDGIEYYVPADPFNILLFNISQGATPMPHRSFTKEQLDKISNTIDEKIKQLELYRGLICGTKRAVADIQN